MAPDGPHVCLHWAGLSTGDAWQPQGDRARAIAATRGLGGLQPTHSNDLLTPWAPPDAHLVCSILFTPSPMGPTIRPLGMPRMRDLLNLFVKPSHYFTILFMCIDAVLSSCNKRILLLF